LRPKRDHGQRVRFGRTHLTSTEVKLDRSKKLGEGSFRVAFAGTFVGGNRNGQQAACKCFKPHYHNMEEDFFCSEAVIIDRAVEYAHGWNQFCKRKIVVNQGAVLTIDDTKYTVEPFIRRFTKFTSNNGWIASFDDKGWKALAMEAFSHYTYHKSGGQLIVCDLQGWYRVNRFQWKKCRFELTDPAICSQSRSYGPTDLGEKGIASFFANHTCNKFCNKGGDSPWAKPPLRKKWFVALPSTSMFSSLYSDTLRLVHPALFGAGLEALTEDDENYD
jgi:Alpha-kinase family